MKQDLKKLYTYSLVCSLFLSFIFVTCSNNSETLIVAQDRGEVIGIAPPKTINKEDIKSLINELEAADIAALYDVSYQTITYHTRYQNKPINTRGLLLLPQGIDSPQFIAYFHGTQVPLEINIFEDEIPSNYDGENDNFREVRNMGLTWATAGYAVFIPDYIGYAITSDQEHPYVYFPEMFESNVDGILAAKSYMVATGYAEQKGVYLTGWSQGAGASLSAHKYIQEKYKDKLQVVASSNLAGPYNFSGFLDDVFARRDEEVNIAKIASWALYSVNKFSGLKRPTDQIWSYPVYDQMSALLTPSNVPEEFLNNFFLAGLQNSTDTALREKFANNSFHTGWKPEGFVFLHHGDADDVVPYFNSVDAEIGLSNAGGTIKLYTYPDGKHDTELKKYILNTLNDFNLLK